MIEVRETDEFASWLSGLTDKIARARILNRIERLQRGNPGDVEPVGEGVSEMRLHFGPGYRVYFIKRGDRFILLLAGGDKATQDRDIIRAKRLAAVYPE